MQVNGINSYSYAPKMAFKGEGDEATAEKKPIDKKVIAGGIAAAVVVAGTTILALHGKKVSGAKGFKAILSNIATGAKDYGSKAASLAKAGWTKVTGLFHKAEKAAPEVVEEVAEAIQ